MTLNNIFVPFFHVHLSDIKGAFSGADWSYKLQSMFEEMHIRNTDLPHCDLSLTLPSCGILRMTLQGRQTEVTTKFSSMVHSSDDKLFFISETKWLQYKLSDSKDLYW